MYKWSKVYLQHIFSHSPSNCTYTGTESIREYYLINFLLTRTLLFLKKYPVKSVLTIDKSLHALSIANFNDDLLLYYYTFYVILLIFI